MNIRVLSQHTPLAHAVATSLRASGHVAEALPFPVYDFDLRYGPSVPIADVGTLVEQLRPLLPSVSADPALTEVDVELRLGDPKPLSHWEVKIYTEDGALADRVRSRLSATGFRDDGLGTGDAHRLKMLYGGCNAFARQTIRYLLAVEGIKVAEKKEWGDDDDDVWLYLHDPTAEGKPAKERYGIELHGDAYEAMSAFARVLEAAGFRSVSLRPVDDETPSRFQFRPGPFAKDPLVAEELRALVESELVARGIDPERHPLDLDESSGSSAVVVMPVAAARSGALRPYAGSWPERWMIDVRTDDVAATAPLRARLAEAGFSGVRVSALGAGTVGFCVRWGAARHDPVVADQIRALVEGLATSEGLQPGYGSVAYVELASDVDDIVVDLPMRVARTTPFADRVREVARSYDCALKTPSPDEASPLTIALRSVPWKAFSLQSEADADQRIQYGGAPLSLVAWVRDQVERHTGVRLPLLKDWGDGDDDIWIHIGSAPVAARSAQGDGPLDLTAWLDDGPAEARPLVDVGAERVRVGPVTLPRRVGGERHLVPSPELFAHYCLDRRTVETLVHVADSVRMAEPCLLEGETSVSKTSIVSYLAMLCDQPIVRLNLNGQTDTGELVGRYVPQDAATALPVDPDELWAAQDLLEEESRHILRRAHAERRALTRVEVQQIMANERMTVHPWRWQDGLVVTAMKRGWWLVLDELNLAEPQILERLNPVLEMYPSLVLTEHDNQVIGPGGHPVHPSFRVFATMNPAEYAGRSPLSPAWRDRWRGYRYVAAPGEHEYLAMLRFLVHGDQPDVNVDGVSYLGSPAAAPMAGLAAVDGIDDFLRALARFHTSLEEAVGRRGGARAGKLGGSRREGYVFSRRGVLAVMEYLARDPDVVAGGRGAVRGMRRAIIRYYLGRVLPGADQRVVAGLLDASGIGPNTWAPERLDALAEAQAAVAPEAGGFDGAGFDEE